MPISSATRPTKLVGVSNGPIRWGEAMRIRGLGPSLLSSPSWVNRAEEALDASPHPNGLDDLGAIGLGTKWDGPKADSSRVYELYTHPCRYRPFWAPNSGCCRRGDRTEKRGGTEGHCHRTGLFRHGPNPLSEQRCCPGLLTSSSRWIKAKCADSTKMTEK